VDAIWRRAAALYFHLFAIARDGCYRTAGLISLARNKGGKPRSDALRQHLHNPEKGGEFSIACASSASLLQGGFSCAACRSNIAGKLGTSSGIRTIVLTGRTGKVD
jgi:hypothetical protein